MRRLLVVVALVAGVIIVPAARSIAAPARLADFNGDGISDLAVGDPFEDVGTASQAGAVNVLYGYPSGLRSFGDQFFTQDSPGVPTNPESGGQLGYAIAAGDFNGDGYSDLAIAVPREDVQSATDAGVVIVLYGSATGLTDDGAQSWSQDTSGVKGNAQAMGHFGYSLAAGDLNGDGKADLAVGASNETVGTVAGAGTVNVLYGSHKGLTTTGNQFWTRNSTGVKGSVQSDGFGSSLAVGNFGKSRQADLAVGAPSDKVGTVNFAGAVNVLYGSPAGLTVAGNQLWTQDSQKVKGSAELDDRFGYTLSAANFGKSGQADLAIGAYAENSQAGGLNVLYGSHTGLTAAGNQFWTRGSPGIKGPVQTGSEFSITLAGADFGKSSQADLAIGAWHENIGAASEAGAVNVLYGSRSGLSAAGNQFFTQNSQGVKDQAEDGDDFGMGVGGANFGRSPQADLVIGAYGEGVGSKARAGAVHVLYGSTSGVRTTGSQFFTQDSPGVAGPGAQPFDGFGCALAPGSPCRD